MSLVLVTGSSAGIGLETARQILERGHTVVAHARDEERAELAREALPGVHDVVVGDLTSLDQTRHLAEQARTVGPPDVVIHNAGVGGGAPERVQTGDGLERIFQVNVVAPYLLTAALPRPARVVYLTSGLQDRGHLHLQDLQHADRPWDGMQAYSDSKLADVALALAVARLWPETLSTAVDPGWIKTRLGGPDAPDPVEDGAATQVWLATADEPAARVTGAYLKRFEHLTPNPQATDVTVQDVLLDRLAQLTGIRLPT
ncbi:SDR family NAD(P)-dependent oxidoreductase [Cellulomonas bogoriensis]|uniref:Short-chain dehydrogenase n=1 Tax=Cellulomonas bogoriensis 69B4 = DSM 16987 TaxID=1386082 RepID=A0A0A0C497_9CELL|nr:SDR family NAD(P)-dependent oxidoreductase [Cellulomonas bogoriensis]KGM14184.1 short-chain dehydrogenase [Cellulomonas bogoriensis 69B4 = DSM 16987]